MVSHRLIDVFGRLGAAPESYTSRADVDRRLAECLESGKHVVIYGRPGQGKTSSVRRLLHGRDYVLVQCKRGQRLPDLYRRLLAEIGVSITTEKRLTRKRRLSATIKIFSGGADTEVQSTEAQMTIDLGNIDDIISALERSGFDDWIVLNDFQNLAASARRQLAADIKYVAERGTVRVLIIGTWSGAVRFLDLNEDSSTFVSQLEVPPWTPEDLGKIIDAAEYLLNVSFSDAVKARCIGLAAGCVRNFHEICYELCRASGILSTQAESVSLDDPQLVEEAARAVYGRPFQSYGEMLAAYLAKVTIDPATSDLPAFAEDVLRWDDSNGAQQIVDWLVTEGIPVENRLLVNEQAIKMDFMTKIVEYDWAGTNEGLQLEVSSRPVAPEDQALGQRFGEDWALRRLLKKQSERDFRPEPFHFDDQTKSLSIVDSKFLAYLHGLSPAALETLAAQRELPLDEVPARARKRLRRRARKWRVDNRRASADTP